METYYSTHSLFQTADRATQGKDEWLTPPGVIRALGPFDLDPCAPVNPPWTLAADTFTCFDNGLTKEWRGFVWCNPPYSTAGKWLARLSGHNGGGIALVFARTETGAFHEHVWAKAAALYFFKGRLRFYNVDGTEGGAAPAPSVLIAYGEDAAKRLARATLPPGKFIRVNPCLSVVEKL
jgi:hypothetical protein